MKLYLREVMVSMGVAFRFIEDAPRQKMGNRGELGAISMFGVSEFTSSRLESIKENAPGCIIVKLKQRNG